MQPRWHRFYGTGLPVLYTEGQGFESRLCQGLSLAGSHWSDIICSAGDDLDRRIASTSGAWNHGSQSSAYGLKKAYVSQGSSDPIWGRQGGGICGESKANSTG